MIYYYSVQQPGNSTQCGAYATAALLGLCGVTPRDVLKHYDVLSPDPNASEKDLQIPAAQRIYDLVKSRDLSGYCSPALMRDVLVSFGYKATLYIGPKVQKAADKSAQFKGAIADAIGADAFEDKGVGQIVTPVLSLNQEIAFLDYHFVCHNRGGGIYDPGAGFGMAWPSPYTKDPLPPGYNGWAEIWITVESGPKANQVQDQTQMLQQE